MLDAQQPVAELVLDHSECAAVFKRHHIDFCCRGEMSIEAVANERGIDLEVLLDELFTAISGRGENNGVDLREKSTPDLIAYIVEKHHAYLREAIPFLVQMAAKVSRVHGKNDPRLVKLDALVDKLADALLPHLDAEEQGLFPLLLADKGDSPDAQSELNSMHEEHLEVSELLDLVRQTTDDFNTPDWACNSYQTLFAELEQLESDTFDHVHIETHILKPRFHAA